MLDWAACEPVGEDNLPLVLEELDLDGVDPRRPAALDDAGDFHVIVIGCGESGVLAGVRLKQAGIGFTILEKNAGPGGTWWENSYPGARVDVANHFYCYSFEPSNHWDHFFAEQPELRRYFADVVDRHDLGPHIRFNTEVRSASWDGDRLDGRHRNRHLHRQRRHHRRRPTQPAQHPGLSRARIPSPGRHFTPRPGITASISPVSASP